ncbi:MAG TPA: hypothetical protein VE863_04425 [Pyrinomonadaceae bacterium]|nr:hypothetical protein [Pyrinomonadaceae bacterium]
MNLRAILLSFAVLLLSASSAFAQSTIMNVPSTDVVAARKIYGEMDFLTNYAWQRQGSFQTYEPRVVIGIPGKLEVGVNVSYTHVAHEQLPIEVQPNVKWQFYSSEASKTAAALGCILYLPIVYRGGSDTLGQCYVVGSKKLNGNNGPRFTAGGFALIGATADERNKFGGIVGYEQPLVKRVSLLVDWFSGDNRLGYVSPGISIVTTRTTALTGGYAIANHGRGKNELFVYYGKQF